MRSPAFSTYTALVALLIAVALSALPGIAVGQSCISDSVGKKVLFARPTITGAPPPGDVVSLMAEVQFAFEIERERRWIEQPTEPVAFLLCEEGGILGRQQWLQRVRDLYYDGVLLEVRSVLRFEGGDLGTEAMLQYALAPAGFFYTEGRAATDGIYGARVPTLKAGDYIAAFINPLEIDAFIALGLGVSYLDARQYDLAFSNLCRAIMHLRLLPSPGFTALLPPQQLALDKLKDFVKSELTRAIEAGLVESDGGTIAFLAETRGEEFATDPCLIEDADG
jgi:hypothetical protein